MTRNYKTTLCFCFNFVLFLLSVYFCSFCYFFLLDVVCFLEMTVTSFNRLITLYIYVISMNKISRNYSIFLIVSDPGKGANQKPVTSPIEQTEKQKYHAQVRHSVL